MAGIVRSGSVARYYIKPNLRQVPCKECQEPTLYLCMTCHESICVMCSFTMTAQCPACRAAYHGEVWVIGKQADAYVRAELDRIFA
jgi:hypothetical protein